MATMEQFTRRWIFSGLALIKLLGVCGASAAEIESFERNSLRGHKAINLPSKKPRIINGFEVGRLRYPYFSLMYGKSLCGGVLIAPRIVLGAAHCVDADERFRIGAFEDVGDGQSVFIQDTISHPKFTDPNQFDYDIMMYVLEDEPDFEYIKLEKNEVNEGKFTVLGFGDTDEGPEMDLSDVLQEVELEYVDSETCDDGHGGRDEVKEDMMCAAGKDKDSCIGDSGGPLIKKGDNSDEDTLVGVVSWGRGCAEEGVPGVYVRISFFYDWIVETICDRFPEDAPPYMECKSVTDPKDRLDIFMETTNPPTNPPTNRLVQIVDFVTPKDDLTGAPTLRPTIPVLSEQVVDFVTPTEDLTRTPTLRPTIPALSGYLTKEPTVGGTAALPIEYPEVEFVEWNSFSPLGECQGDCDTDEECAGGLVCFKRSSETSLNDIPGCSISGNFGKNVDICVDFSKV